MVGEMTWRSDPDVMPWHTGEDAQLFGNPRGPTRPVACHPLRRGSTPSFGSDTNRGGHPSRKRAPLRQAFGRPDDG